MHTDKLLAGMVLTAVGSRRGRTEQRMDRNVHVGRRKRKWTCECQHFLHGDLQGQGEMVTFAHASFFREMMFDVIGNKKRASDRELRCWAQKALSSLLQIPHISNCFKEQLWAAVARRATLGSCDFALAPLKEH